MSGTTPSESTAKSQHEHYHQYLDQLYQISQQWKYLVQWYQVPQQ